jgi:diguanylate cyclase (GGDEF)-like protein
MTTKVPISNRKLILRIIMILLSISIVTIVFSSFYIKKVALNNLGEDDTKKTSELVFEIMNTKMQEGWGKQDLIQILNKLEHIREGLEVSSYRSEKVEAILGIYEPDKKIVENDPLIQKALKGEKQFLIQDDGSIRYLYPMRVKQECITCHYNTKVGDVNGVLDITYPPSEIKISLDILISYFLIFFILFILLCFIVLYFIINKKIIEPVVLFTSEIDEIAKDTDLSKKSDINPSIKELYILENHFNDLLKKIKFYYDKLINNLYTDSLTRLPNMVKLKEDIKKNKKNTLMIVNIDSFKEINNFYGVKVGDEILKQIAMYLHEKTKKVHNLYRLYSDEFAILSQEDLSKEYCTQLINSLNKESCRYQDTDIEVQSSLGVVYNSENRIIEKATIALRTAKKNKTVYEEFDNSLELQEEYKNHITWSINIKEMHYNVTI